MKLILKVETETRDAGINPYTTLALSVACDDPDVTVSMGEVAGKGMRLFLTSRQGRIPLQLDDVLEISIGEDPHEEPVE